MSNTKFTPGPWTIQKRSIGANEGSYYGKGDKYIGMFSFSVGHHTDRMIWRQEGEANAKLIAAVPDLFDLAQRLDIDDRFLNEFDNMDQLIEQVKSWATMAKSAIKKATA